MPTKVSPYASGWVPLLSGVVGLVGCERGIPTQPLLVLILQLGVASHHAVNDQEVAAQKREVTATFLVELLLA